MSSVMCMHSPSHSIRQAWQSMHELPCTATESPPLVPSFSFAKCLWPSLTSDHFLKSPPDRWLASPLVPLRARSRRSRLRVQDCPCPGPSSRNTATGQTSLQCWHPVHLDFVNVNVHGYTFLNLIPWGLRPAPRNPQAQSGY